MKFLDTGNPLSGKEPSTQMVPRLINSIESN